MAFSAIADGMVSTTDTTLVENDEAVSWFVLRMAFTNTDVSARTLTVHLIKSGDSKTDSNLLYKEVSINAGDTYLDEKAIHLTNGDKLIAFADVAAKVNFSLNLVT